MTLELPLKQSSSSNLFGVHPFPKVNPACDFVALLVELEASFAPAFESTDLDGLPPFPILVTPFHLNIYNEKPELMDTSECHSALA